MTASEQIIERAKKVIPGGVNSSVRKIPPMKAWKYAKGAYMYDVEGKRYIDYNAAWGVNILGYHYDEVDQAVKEAIDKYCLLGLGTTELEVEFAERVCRHVPCADKVLVAGSGSEATYHAIRVCRAATGREKIIKFQGCFHGWHDFVLRNCYANTVDELYTRAPGSAGMLDAAVDATLICRLNDLNNVEETLKANKGQVACIIVEPLVHNMGAVQLEQTFLEGLRKLCNEYGAKLIFDEVVTGFRVGLSGYQGICGVTPDMCTMGKAIGNGYPIAILAGKAELMDMFNTTPEGTVSFQGTYNAPPVCLAAGIKVMDIMEREPVHQRIFELGARFRSGMQEIFDRLDIEAEMLGYGSINVPIFARGPFRNQEEILKGDAKKSVAFRKAMVERGYYFPPAEPKRLVVTYSHTEQDIDETLQVAEDVLRSMKK